MALYSEDRAFTDFVHANLALPKIYKGLGWNQVDLDHNFAQEIDMQKGIDYIFKDVSGALKTVQERFRESKYQRYSDFTIRYRRDNNIHSSRRESEYYKMEADFFTYGITNCLKTDASQCTDFIKYAVIDMRKVYEKLDSGQILIRDNGKNVCSIEDNRIICPVKYNGDGSSSFFPIEISFLVKLWGAELIVDQKGFF